MYSTISNLGKSVNYHTEQDNPLTYCLAPKFESQWIHGSTTTNKLMTPQCEPCQLYMSERCANEWDDACEMYVANNQDTAWPNMGAIDYVSQRNANYYLQHTPTTGEHMIRNSIEKRFFIYPSSSMIHVPFDPNMASSPYYTKISTESQTPTWMLNPQMMGTLHNDDKYTRLMLENPKTCFDLLARFHKLSTQQPQLFLQLSGNKSNSNLDKFLKENHEIFMRYHQRQLI